MIVVLTGLFDFGLQSLLVCLHWFVFFFGEDMCYNILILKTMKILSLIMLRPRTQRAFLVSWPPPGPYLKHVLTFDIFTGLSCFDTLVIKWG